MLGMEVQSVPEGVVEVPKGVVQPPPITQWKVVSRVKTGGMKNEWREDAYKTPYHSAYPHIPNFPRSDPAHHQEHHKPSGLQDKQAAPALVSSSAHLGCVNNPPRDNSPGRYAYNTVPVVQSEQEPLRVCSSCFASWVGRELRSRSLEDSYRICHCIQCSEGDRCKRRDVRRRGSCRVSNRLDIQIGKARRGRTGRKSVRGRCSVGSRGGH